MMPPKRRAILIGDPGPKGNQLPGVSHDMQNMYGYLLSPRGGGWLQSEITVLWGKRRTEILATVGTAEADYLFVYYSGHGSGHLAHTWQGGSWILGDIRRLELRTGEYIEDFELINERVPRQLVICDSCRTRPGASIGGIPETLEGILYTEDEVYGGMCWFNRYIDLSPVGRLIVHSTQDEQPAMDSRDGGMFTLALLEGGLYWQEGGGYAPVGVEALVGYAAEVLGGGGKPQVPEIVYSSGDLKVPFALDTPWPWQSAAPTFVPAGYDRDLEVQDSPRQDPVNGWLALGGIALGVWLLSKWGE